MAGHLPVKVSSLYHKDPTRTSTFSHNLKKTTSSRYRKSAKREPNGACESPFNVAEQLSFENPLGQRGTVYRHE